MKRIIATSLALLLTLSPAAPVHAQGIEWETLNKGRFCPS